MDKIVSFNDFSKIDMRIGKIIEVRDFVEAKKPAYKLLIDFGKLGIKKSSAQLPYSYSKSVLLNKYVVAVINFPAKQIAHFKSECLVLGAVENKRICLLGTRTPVPLGTKVV